MSTHDERDPEFHDVPPKAAPRRPFSFIRVALVLGIIGVLIALFFPASRGARPAARRAQCVMNLKQIGLALNNYEKFYGMLPPAYTTNASGRPLHSWRTLILPWLDELELYNKIDLTRPWNDPVNAQAFRTGMSPYVCPDLPDHGNRTTYLALTGPDRYLLSHEPRRLATITDAPRMTLAVIEVDADHAVPWMKPVDADDALVLDLKPATAPFHPGGINVLFADGYVNFLQATMPEARRRALLSVAAGADRADENY